MPTRFETVSVPIPGDTGSRTILANATFPSDVLRAGVALNGFNLDYTNGDRNMGRIMADTDVVAIAGPVVSFEVQCELRDNSGNDPYAGFVTALVTAETVS